MKIARRKFLATAAGALSMPMIARTAWAERTHCGRYASLSRMPRETWSNAFHRRCGLSGVPL